VHPCVLCDCQQSLPVTTETGVVLAWSVYWLGYGMDESEFEFSLLSPAVLKGRVSARQCLTVKVIVSEWLSRVVIIYSTYYPIQLSRKWFVRTQRRTLNDE
jgi:hypothetical protein